MSIIKDTAQSSSFLYTVEGMSQVASGPNSVSATNDSGVFINGPLSISSPPSSIKIGAVFRINPLTATCFPSTMITPIPLFQMDLPVQNIAGITGIASMVLSTL